MILIRQQSSADNHLDICGAANRHSVVYNFTSDQYIAMLHTSIGTVIAGGQYYWILGALLGIFFQPHLKRINSCLRP